MGSGFSLSCHKWSVAQKCVGRKGYRAFKGGVTARCPAQPETLKQDRPTLENPEYIGAGIPAPRHMMRIPRNENACHAAHVLRIGQTGGEIKINSSLSLLFPGLRVFEQSVTGPGRNPGRGSFPPSSFLRKQESRDPRGAPCERTLDPCFRRGDGMR